MNENGEKSFAFTMLAIIEDCHEREIRLTRRVTKLETLIDTIYGVVTKSDYQSSTDREIQKLIEALEGLES